MGNGVTQCEWRHAPEARGRFLGYFERISELRLDTGRVEMRPASGEDGWFLLARGDLCGGCHTCWGWGQIKSQNSLCLSPYVEEPLKSKVIKGFVPEQRSRYVFFEFRDSYVLSLWTFDVRFTHSHIMAMVHNQQSVFLLRVTEAKITLLNFGDIAGSRHLCLTWL